MVNTSSKKVLILGSFSGNNFGDNIVLEAIVSSIQKESKVSVTFFIPTKNPSFIKHYFNSAKVIPIDIDFSRTKSIRFLSVYLFKKLKEFDLIITTAGILFDYKLFDPRFNFISTLLPLLFCAKYNNIPVLGWGVGISPPTNKIGSFVLKKTLDQHSYIITRDAKSFDLLKKLTPKVDAKSCCDLAHILFTPEKKQVSNGKVLGINFTEYFFNDYGYGKSSLNPEELLNDFLINISAKKILFISTTSADQRFVKNKVKIKSEDIEVDYVCLADMRLKDAYQYFSEIHFFIGTRLHSCISSTSLGIPTIGLDYHPKVKDYFEEINLGQYCLGKSELGEIGLIKQKINNLIKYEKLLKKKLQNISHQRRRLAKETINMVEYYLNS